MLPGKQNPTPRNIAWKTLSWMRTFIPAAIRKTGSEEVAAAGSAQSRCGGWRSSGDYAVRGERGDPRGRKSGGGSGADNPICLAWAEGGKRFRSATRNP